MLVFGTAFESFPSLGHQPFQKLFRWSKGIFFKVVWKLNLADVKLISSLNLYHESACNTKHCLPCCTKAQIFTPAAAIAKLMYYLCVARMNNRAVLRAKRLRSFCARIGVLLLFSKIRKRKKRKRKGKKRW